MADEDARRFLECLLRVAEATLRCIQRTPWNVPARDRTVRSGVCMPNGTKIRSGWKMCSGSGSTTVSDQSLGNRRRIWLATVVPAVPAPMMMRCFIPLPFRAAR